MFASTDSSLFGRLHERVRRRLFAALCFCFYSLLCALSVEAAAVSSDVLDLQQSSRFPDLSLSSRDSSSALAGQPLLRILFSGNTRGALFPCPT